MSIKKRKVNKMSKDEIKQCLEKCKEQKTSLYYKHLFERLKGVK